MFQLPLAAHGAHLRMYMYSVEISTDWRVPSITATLCDVPDLRVANAGQDKGELEGMQGISR